MIEAPARQHGIPVGEADRRMIAEIDRIARDAELEASEER
jgi:hypothetical protein